MAALLIDLFEAETERMLQNDDSTSVARIAALNVHYTAVLFTRPEEQAVKFLDQAIALCDELYGWHEPSPLYDIWCQSSDDEKALSHVLWSVCSIAV